MVFITAVPALAQSGPSTGKPKATVELLASAQGIVPGQPMQIALHFTIDEGWHIYWINSGESGMAPRVNWTAPEGVEIGALQFPVPKRHVDAAGITTFILEDEPALLADVTTSKGFSAKTVHLEAKLRFLVCQEQCLIQKEELKLDLPVVSEAKPDNNHVFTVARKMLPGTASKYVTVTPSLASKNFSTGAKFDITIGLSVAPGFHIQSHKPTLPTFYATEVFLEPTPGLTFGKAEYPVGKTRTLPGLGEVSEYEGTVTVRIPSEVSDAITGDTLRLAGVLAYQACDELGKCFPPDSLAFSTSMPVKRAAADEPQKTKLADGQGAAGESDLRNGGIAAATGATPSVTDGPESKTFLHWLALAFLGGLILNVMPCVLPVISIKILSFVHQSRESPGRVFRLGLTFCAGMLISFWALAIAIILLKEAGSHIGWGFQFQSPRFVIAMMAMIFVFSLSLLGVFIITLPGAAATHLSAAEEHEGYTGAFMKGVLGTVLATPCTAPFLGPALGAAFKSSHTELFAMFTAIGLGMASPFFILTANPKWLKFLPRPGTWMEHFKQFMGFLVLGTVVWLMFTLGDQIGADGLTRTGVFLLALGFSCWLLGRQTPLTPVVRRLTAWVAAIGIACGGWWIAFERKVTIETLVMAQRAAIAACICEDDEVPALAREAWDEGIPWQMWAPGLAERWSAQGYTVYVDYTATWCATCLANKKATLEPETVRFEMRDRCVIPMKADFTLQDPDILADLQKFDRSGVPLNVIYPAGRPEEPIVMPEQLVGRSGLVLEKLNEAGSSTNCKIAAAGIVSHSGG